MFLAINLALFAALAWAMEDPMTIRIYLSGDTPVAEVEGVQLPSPEPAAKLDTLGLYLDGPGHPYAPNGWQDYLQRLMQPWFWLDADQGWAALAAFANGQATWGHDFARDGLTGWHDPTADWAVTPLGDAMSASGGMLMHGDVPLARRQLVAVLERGHAGAGLVVGDAASGLLLLVRPLHRDFMWWQLRDGAWQGPLAGAAFQRPWYSALKDMLRMLLRPYFLALALAASVLLIGWITRTLTRSSTADPERSTMPRALAWPIVVGLAVAVLGATAFIADTLLERMPHIQDDVAYLFQAHVFALGRLWAPLPPLPQFFVQEFVVMQDGRWFAKYPPGFPAILSLGVAAGAPWLVDPIAAMLAIVATYALGAKAHGRGTGLLAALLLALSPFFLILAGTFMSHTTGLLFAALFALGYVAADRGSRWAAVAVGLALGVDLLIRPWTAFCIAAPFAVDMAVRMWRQPRPTLARASLMVLGLAPFLAVYFAYNDLFTGDPLKTTMELWWPFDRLGFGPDKGMAGHTTLNGLLNSLRNVGELSRDAFGWPAIATFAFAFLPFASGRPGRWDWLWLASWFSLMFGYFFWWADGVMYGPRFYHEAMPFMVLLTARGLAVLGELGGAPGRLISAPILASLLAINLAFYLPGQLPHLKGYNYVSTASIAAVERAGIRDGIVFTDAGPPAEWWNYGMVFSANSPLLDTSVIYARDLGVENERLMALYPGRRYYRLYRTSVTEIQPGGSP